MFDNIEKPSYSGSDNPKLEQDLPYVSKWIYGWWPLTSMNAQLISSGIGTDLFSSYRMFPTFTFRQAK